MSIEIRPAVSKSEVKKFVKFPFRLYKDNDCWVPPLIMDDLDTLNPEKNPAFESAEVKLFMAFKDGEPAGRIAAILNHTANKKYNSKNLRFGWFDTIDDYEVASALFNTVESWGKERGMETITGPHGFTDLDPEGMLVEGFDQLATIAVYYNHAYYNDLTTRYGFSKDVDYLEFRSVNPIEDGIPPKLLSLGEKLKQRSGVRIVRFKTKKEIMALADNIFYLLDEAFEEIYGSVPLTEKQVKYYVKKYFPFVDRELLQVAVDEHNEVVGFMIAMPSLSRAMQKARGRLFPFGWLYILRALKSYDVLDFYLAGVKKKYRGLGVDTIMVLEVVKAALKKGFRFAESNPELEENKKVHAQWKFFNPTQHKRRRIYRKTIS